MNPTIGFTQAEPLLKSTLKECIKTIVIGVDEHRVNEEASQTLANEPGIYQRGGILVNVIETTANSEPGVIRRSVGSPIVRELSQPMLRDRLTHCAMWMKHGKEGELYPAHPPAWCISAVYSRGEWADVRHLDAVISHPILLFDGSILATNGYNRPSSLLVKLSTNLICDVPEKPTQEDVANALSLIFDVVNDFPFESAEHRSAWLAGLLTPLAWFMFEGPAPLFLFDGNNRGIGKGLLADAIALIVSGRRFPIMSYTNEREELRKKITSLAVEGERLVLLDNLTGSVGNEILDAALTSDRWKDRLLGGNRIYDGPLHVVWYATGNNVQLHADTSRRICHVRLQSNEERPEFREGFKYPDLRRHILCNRGPLLSAALTILRGWIVAGRPTHGLKSWGSYEGWSGIIREAIVFARQPDPGETRLALQNDADRDAQAMEVLLICVQQMDQASYGVTAADVIDKIKNQPCPVPSWLGDLKSAVEELCGKLDSRTLGYRLRHFQRRNFNGLMLTKGSQDRTNVNRWIVVPVQHNFTPVVTSPSSPAFPASSDLEFAGEEGDAGDVSDQCELEEFEV